MPAYNSAKYIDQAIDSILNQTYADFELIIINDGSTDKTAAIVKSYNDNRIRYFAWPQNHGIVIALNKGIYEANGKLIARHDSDDASDKNRFEKQISYLQANPQCALLGSERSRMDADGNVGKHISSGKIKALTIADLQERNPIIHGSVMMRKDALQEIGVYSPTFRHCEDYELWLRFLAKGYQFAILPDRLYQLRDHAESDSYINHKQQSMMMYLARDLHADKITESQVNYYAKDVAMYYPQLPKADQVWFHNGCATKLKTAGDYTTALHHYRQMQKLHGYNWKIIRNILKMKLKTRN